MNNQSLNYPSKLMLFGEYAVIAGGEGLAIPYPTFSAQWKFNTSSPSEYKPHLEHFLVWLKANNFDSILQLSVFENDLQTWFRYGIQRSCWLWCREFRRCSSGYLR
jgi:hypothetical protein